MGAVCCKPRQKKVLPLPREETEDTTAHPLKTRNEFQMMWESKQGEQGSCIDYIWPLSIPKRDVHDVYVFDKTNIGMGNYGSVRKAKHRQIKNKIFAVKSVNKLKLHGDISLFKNELDMLRFADHPNIVRFYEIYQDFNFYYFVMEYCEGGDITSRVQDNGAMEESVVRNIIFQALLAINNLHACGIVHRDIKADNFLFKSSSEDSSIKLSDFGLSKRFQMGSKMQSMVGTPYYVAPEVIIKRGYTEKCDIWSVGVMMYMLLVADFPFRGSTNSETFDKIKRGDFSMSASKQLLGCSLEGKQFLKKLLDKNPSQRFSAREALRDDWFNKLNIERLELGHGALTRAVLEKAKNSKSMTKFSKEVIRLLVVLHDNDKAVVQLRDAYFYIDVLNNGVISNVEILRTFDELGAPLKVREADALVQSFAMRSKKALTYTDFVTATIDDTFFSNDERLKEVFQRLDIDGDSYISPEDLVEFFSRCAIEMPRSTAASMLTEVSKGDRLSYASFLIEINKYCQPRKSGQEDLETDERVLLRQSPSLTK